MSLLASKVVMVNVGEHFYVVRGKRNSRIERMLSRRKIVVPSSVFLHKDRLQYKTGKGENENGENVD